MSSQVAGPSRFARIVTKSAVTRIGWGFTSQALSSATNFLLSVLVLRDGGLTTFGYFTLVFFAYLLGLNVVRAVVGTPMLLSARGHRASGGGHAVAVVLGLALAVLGLPLVLLLPAEYRHIGLLMAVALPFTLIQDSQRFVSFADEKPVRAARLDGVWLLVMVGLSVPAGVDPLLSWTVGAMISAAVGIAGPGLRPSFGLARHFLKVTRFWRGGLLGEAAGSLVVLQASPYLVALVVGIGSFGALRAAYTVVAPIAMVVSGIAPALLVSYQRVLRRRPAALRRLVGFNAGWLAAMAAGYVAVVLVVPVPVLVFAFGPAVADVLPLVVPIGTSILFFVVLCTILDALRGTLEPRVVAVVRVTAGCTELAGSLVGGLLDGVEGAAIGGAAGMLAALAVTVVLLLRSDPTTSRAQPAGLREDSG